MKRRHLKIAGLVAGGLLLVLALLYAAILAAWYEPDREPSSLRARWAPPPSEFIEIEGMQVHLRDEGPRDDPSPIVLLHGTSASLHTWDGWTAALAGEHRVIRFDLPAFGLTGPAPDADYRIERYAEFVVAVLDARGVQRCTLAGNSLGGYIAWATALLHPDRVERLVLIDSAGLPFEPESIPIGFRLARMPVINRLIENVLPRAVVRSSVETVYGDPSLVTPELVDRYFELTTRAGNRRALVQRLEQMQPGALAERLSELKLPTLILWGDKDSLIGLDVGQRLHEGIANSDLVRFTSLGHVPHEESPAATVAALEAFLAANE